MWKSENREFFFFFLKKIDFCCLFLLHHSGRRERRHAHRDAFYKTTTMLWRRKGPLMECFSRELDTSQSWIYLLEGVEPAGFAQTYQIFKDGLLHFLLRKDKVFLSPLTTSFVAQTPRGGDPAALHLPCFYRAPGRCPQCLSSWPTQA